MKHFMLCVFLVLCNRLTAALPGVPEGLDATRVAPWVTVSNDSFGFAPGPDDNRTAEELAGFYVSGFVFEVDHSMLTALGADNPTRIDEVTLTGGKAFDVGIGRLTLGAGAILRGNYAGQVIQDRFHAGTQSGSQIHVPFDGGSAAPVVYFLFGNEPFKSDRDGAAVGPAYSVSSIVAPGEVSVDVFAGISATQLETKDFVASAVHLGLREQYRWTDLPSPTIRRTFLYEDGLWVDFGICFRWLELGTRYSPFHHESVSQATIRF